MAGFVGASRDRAPAFLFRPISARRLLPNRRGQAADRDAHEAENFYFQVFEHPADMAVLAFI